MEIIHMRKAFWFIARGLFEKNKLIQRHSQSYPYSMNLQRGINMFLAAALEIGGMGKEIFAYSDENAFLSKYILKPVNEWFDGWNSDVYEKLNLREQPFYHYDALAYRIGNGNTLYVPSEECIEFLETQEKDNINEPKVSIIEETDEYSLFEQLKRLNQDNYCKVRKFIIEHPIIDDGELREIKCDLADVTAAYAITLAYERFEEKAYCCPVCGWTMTKNAYGFECMTDDCLKRRPYKELDGTNRSVLRLKKGIMRYFAIPGKLEMDIAAFCEKNNLKYSLWPYMDKYDIEIVFSDNSKWEIDAKAYRNPISLRGKIEKDGGFPRGDYQRGFYVVPNACKRRTTNYTDIVNRCLTEQKNVTCVTLSKIKTLIKTKLGECNE